MKYQQEHDSIVALSGELLKKVDGAFGKRRTIAFKTSPRDIVSDLDRAIDRVIVKTIKRIFPRDTLVTEESSPHAFKDVLLGKRGWVIDPLCGSSNVERGVRWFATNFALVEEKKVVAAWVIDHSRKRLLWGVGEQKIYDNKAKIVRLNQTRAISRVDVDTGYVYLMPRRVQQQYASFTQSLQLSKRHSVCRLGSSLSFAYVATGQIEGATTINVHPWDLLASAFLIEQNGGRVTALNNTPWGLASRSLVMAGNEGVGRELLKHLKKAGLMSIP